MIEVAHKIDSKANLKKKRNKLWRVESDSATRRR